MIRLLAWLAVFLGISWLLRRLLGTGSTRRTARPGGRDRTPPSSGLMVRDPICSTYLPKDRARVLRDASGLEHYFCSEACEMRFLEDRTGS